ncbi:hypothetical protein M427DRAFT_283190 [Gonapodya prolifera JEL478]|uniref:Uncharacterized protein n=1 Tax=Gonapodya prolifera (strain JEL478) TaxID=1344416 RepID=A0A139AIW0_GONPJ|nr:hypothetical protein M427DRAFT_283190 [Gonapodya prolifera JEL478]|eukprot:KXS16742.1 hypothetical protein M427DRAFT_283190 [Gonapodya prolifera JEL478]
MIRRGIPAVLHYRNNRCPICNLHHYLQYPPNEFDSLDFSLAEHQLILDAMESPHSIAPNLRPVTAGNLGMHKENQSIAANSSLTGNIRHDSSGPGVSSGVRHTNSGIGGPSSSNGVANSFNQGSNSDSGGPLVSARGTMQGAAFTHPGSGDTSSVLQGDTRIKRNGSSDVLYRGSGLHVPESGVPNVGPRSIGQQQVAREMGTPAQRTPQRGIVERKGIAPELASSVQGFMPQPVPRQGSGNSLQGSHRDHTSDKMEVPANDCVPFAQTGTSRAVQSANGHTSAQRHPGIVAQRLDKSQVHLSELVQIETDHQFRNLWAEDHLRNVKQITTLVRI